MKPLQAYRDGQWIPASDLAIAVDDLGFLVGATVAERLRTFSGRVFRLEEHLRRMRHSLEIIGLDAERLTAELAEVISEFIRQNGDHIAADDDWSVLAFVTPGIVGSGRPTVCVHGFPLTFHQWAEQYDRGSSAVVSDVRQVPPSCWPAQLKCRSRMHYYLANLQASQQQPGARAVLLDEQGYVAETPTANILLYRESEGLLSPPEEHILFGVSLHVVQELAERLAVPFVKRHVTVEELLSAEEAMLTSTSHCILPIVRCNGQPIGDGTPGPTYRRLLAAWSEMVGVDIVEQARRFASR